MNTYPYFIYPDVIALRNGNLSDNERRKATARIIANVGDPAALRIILGMDPEEFAAFYPDMTTSTPSTSDTIDAFINKFGKNSDSTLQPPVIAEILEEKEISNIPEDLNTEEIGSLFSPKNESSDQESIIFDEESPLEKVSNQETTPETDNEQQVANNKQEILNTEEVGSHLYPKNESSDRESTIFDEESPLEKVSNQETTPETDNEQQVLINKQEILNTEEVGIHFSPKNESSDRETVADLIKNRRYQEAINRLTALNLNNPKKSVYFAHQISFLKKLIANEARKAKNIERNQK